MAQNIDILRAFTEFWIAIGGSKINIDQKVLPYIKYLSNYDINDIKKAFDKLVMMGKECRTMRVYDVIQIIGQDIKNQKSQDQNNFDDSNGRGYLKEDYPIAANNQLDSNRENKR